MSVAAARVERLDLRRLADAINAEHLACLRHRTAYIEHARRCGELLIAAKAKMPHGSWLPWLRANCGAIKVRQLQKYTRLAEGWPAIEAAASNAAHGAHSLSINEALQLLAEGSRDSERDKPSLHDAREVPIDSIVVPPTPWDVRDVENLQRDLPRLESSTLQPRPLMVRTVDAGVELVFGRSMLAALRASGHDTAWVYDLSDVTDADAAYIARHEARPLIPNWSMTRDLLRWHREAAAERAQRETHPAAPGAPRPTERNDHTTRPAAQLAPATPRGTRGLRLRFTVEAHRMLLRQARRLQAAHALRDLPAVIQFAVELAHSRLSPAQQARPERRAAKLPPPEA